MEGLAVNNDPTTLIHAYLDGELTGDQHRQLTAWLQEDQINVDRFVAECRLHSELCDTHGVGSAVQLPSQLSHKPSAASHQPSFIPPIILDFSPTVREPSLTTLFAPGGFLFSYTMSAVLVGIGLLVGWTWRVSYDRRVVHNGPREAAKIVDARPDTPSVGRITGVVDCQWADPATATIDQADVSMGRRYALAAGFLEITYDTGAKVILQGPATYEVESARGGFLSLGKLCALVEKKGESSGVKGERTANPTPSRSGTEPTASLAPHPSGLSHLPSKRGAGGEGDSGSRLSTLDSRLFFIRTPTAVVTDLGTEFGVEVDKSGATKSHVFRGKVELRLAGGGNERRQAIPLRENESAIVEAGQHPAVKMIRHARPTDAPVFARQMPQWAPFKLFNTGAGLREGDPDPRWQITARSDDPQFQPQAAVVAATPRAYLPNDPSRSQWISTAGNLPSMPEAQFTFRTTFQLAEASPDSIVLQGGFIVDNCVKAILINGKSISAPEHRNHPPFDQFSPFVVRSGFVKGTNVLEIEVYNFPSARKHGAPTPMALRVELRGVQLRGLPVPATNAADKEGQRVK
jgi:hypothetical protein